MDVAVNATSAATALSFPGTGAWTSWQTRTFPASLVAGSNTVRVTASTADGGPNLDYLEVPA
jgi:hypothetical protein